MAQVSKICNGGQSSQLFHNVSNAHKPKSVASVSLRSPFNGFSSSRGLKHNKASGNCAVNAVRAVPLRVSASVATAEKAPEIVLQPIKEISGTVTLPGSKSLSNRVLLLAALSEGCANN